MAITRPNAASHVYLRQPTLTRIQRYFRYVAATMQFPALAFSMYTANFARVEKLRFSPAFLYTRFNFFYVKYHASAACHGEINFSKLPSTQFAREKLPRLKQCKNSVEEEIKTVKDRGNGDDIIFVVLITYLPFVRKASLLA